MRVLHVHAQVDGEVVDLALHPQLTVVRRLGAPARRWLIDAVGRLGSTHGAAPQGEVEAGGIIFPLTDATLELLGLTDSPSGVVTPEMLGVGVTANDVAEPAPLDPEAVGVANEPATTTAAVEVVADPVEVRAVEPVPAPPTPVERRLTSLRHRRVELARLLDDVTIPEVGDVPAALADLDAAPVGAPVPGAASLADEWTDLQKEWRGLEVGATAEERAALTAVARAQAAVAEAEAVLRQPQLTEEQMRRIEAAHAATSEASDRVERRFGGGRARKQLADAEVEEMRLLERFGFESWVDYMLRTSKRAADPEMTQEKADLEAAQVELEVCIAELDAIPGAVGRRHRRTRLRERQEELSDRIAPVLGRQPVGDEVADELRSLTVAADRSREAAAVAAALAEVGVAVAADRRGGGRPDADAVAAMARRLLAAVESAGRRRADLEVALEALEAEIAVLEELARSGEAELPDRPRLPDMAEPPMGLLEMLDQGDAGERRPDGAVAADLPDPDGEAAPEPVAAEVADQEVTASETEAEAEAEPEVEAEAEPDPAEPGEDPQVDPATSGLDAPDLTDRPALVDDVHWEALRAIARLRDAGPAGQLPVVFDDPFGLLDAHECVEVLARLVRLTDLVQMVVVTDRPEVAEWAAAIGSEHASVVG